MLGLGFWLAQAILLALPWILFKPRGEQSCHVWRAAAAAIVCGVIFGIAPALSAGGVNPMGMLKDGGRTGTSARGRRARGVFVVVETALALVLLVGAGLLVRSFVELMRPLGLVEVSRTGVLSIQRGAVAL